MAERNTKKHSPNSSPQSRDEGDKYTKTDKRITRSLNTVKGNTKQGNSNKKSSLISIASWILVLEHAFECVRSTDSKYSRRPPSVVYAWSLRDYKKSPGEGEITTRNPAFFFLSLSLFFKSQGRFYFTLIISSPCFSELTN